MSAVAEMTSRDLLHKPYNGPVCMMGTPVIYWKSGKRNAGGMVIGFARINNFRDDGDGKMTIMNRGMVSIHVPHLGIIDSVMHADDPRLGANSDQRANGCWEHTPYHHWLMEMNQRLAKFVFDSAKAPKNGPKTQGRPKNTPAGGSSTGGGDGEEGEDGESSPTLDSLTP